MTTVTSWQQEELEGEHPHPQLTSSQRRLVSLMME